MHVYKSDVLNMFSHSQHVLICGDLKSSSLREFFNELFHEDHDIKNLHAVILQVMGLTLLLLSCGYHYYYYYVVVIIIIIIVIIIIMLLLLSLFLEVLLLLLL